MENKLKFVLPTRDQTDQAKQTLIKYANEYPTAKRIRLGYLPYTGKFTHDPIYDRETQHISKNVHDAIKTAVDPDGCENATMNLDYIHVAVLEIDPRFIKVTPPAILCVRIAWGLESIQFQCKSVIITSHAN